MRYYGDKYGSISIKRRVAQLLIGADQHVDGLQERKTLDDVDFRGIRSKLLDASEYETSSGN